MILIRFHFILENIFNKEPNHILKVKVNSEWQPPSGAEYQAFEMECDDPEKNLNSLQTGKCATKCVLERADFFDETRGFYEERLIKMMVVRGRSTENIARGIIGGCDFTKGDLENVCDWADRGIKCIRKEKNKYFRSQIDSFTKRNI